MVDDDKDAAFQRGIEAERKRVSSILKNPLATGNEKLAIALALQPNITPVLAQRIFAAAAEDLHGKPTVNGAHHPRAKQTLSPNNVVTG